MHFSLVMKLNDGTERKFPLGEKKTLIGRETRCQVRIALPTVADRHCEIVLDNGELVLSDLGSELGTFVNGTPVRKAVIGPADEVTVGPVTFHLRHEQPADAAATQKAPHNVVPADGHDEPNGARQQAESEIEVNVRSSDRLTAQSPSRNAPRSASTKDDR